MQMMPLSGAQSESFQANRARGRVDLAVAGAGNRTLLRRLGEEGSLRVRFPAATGEFEAVLLNTAGGIAGGDRFEIAVEVGPGGSMSLTTAAAEKVYRALGRPARVAVSLTVAEGASLSWLPQETILFDDAGLDRTIAIDLDPGARLVFVESMVLGRAAMGERLATGAILDRWRLRRGGRLVFADGLRLDGAIAATLDTVASAAGGAAMATVLLAPGGDDIVAAVRGRESGYAGEVGASAWNGIAAVRLLARDGAALRRDLVAVLAAIGAPLPRLWTN